MEGVVMGRKRRRGKGLGVMVPLGEVPKVEV